MQTSQAKRSPHVRQNYRRSLAARLAERLDPGDLYRQDPQGRQDRGQYYSDLLMLEADPENHYVGDFGTYRQGLAFWRPSLRISPTYSQEIRRRSYREARAGIQRAEAALTPAERVAMVKGWRGCLGWKHVTLTMQHGPEESTFDQIKRFNRAFSLLRKRLAWTLHVRAAVKGVEDKLTARGSHVHAHLMILSDRLDLDQWVKDWRECLGGLGGIKIQAIKARPIGGDDEGPECSTEGALREVCKYITKTEDLLKPDVDGNTVSRDQLLTLCDVWRWPRMFELLGAARQTRDAEGGALCLILPEYSTAAIFGEDLEALPYELHWSEIDQLQEEKAKYWRIHENGGVQLGTFDHGPPGSGMAGKTRKHFRRPSWRELMFRLPADEWTRRINHRYLQAQKRRSLYFRARYIALEPLEAP